MGRSQIRSDLQGAPQVVFGILLALLSALLLPAGVVTGPSVAHAVSTASAPEGPAHAGVELQDRRDGTVRERLDAVSGIRAEAPRGGLAGDHYAALLGVGRARPDLAAARPVGITDSRPVLNQRWRRMPPIGPPPAA